MKLYGITLDFNDMKSCGLLPDMCLDWDHRSEELSENQKLLSYWDKHLKDLLDETNKVVVINDEHKSMVYSKDKNAVDLIKKHFKEIELSAIDYENMNRCDYCVQHDYLQSS